MRIAHLADLHLGFRAYHRLNSQGVNQREADVFASFREALDRVSALSVDLVLLAGDIFHVPRPSNYAIVQAQRELQRFRQKCAAPIVMIAGNHESVRSTDNRCILEVLETISGVKAICHRTEKVVLAETCRLVCIPHNDLPQITDYHCAPEPQYDYNLLMVHGTVDSDRINDYGGHDVPRSLVQAGWDYVACGHFHSYTHLGGNAYYAGAIERTSNNIWQEAEEAKGFVEFSLDRHTPTFHPLTKPRNTIDLPLIDADHYTIEQLNQVILDQARQVNITDKVVRQKVVNISRTVQTKLDHRSIRQLQTQALHYFLDVRSPEQSAFDPEQIASDSITDSSTDALAQSAKNFLANYPLPKGVSSQELVERGLQYLEP